MAAAQVEEPDPLVEINKATFYLNQLVFALYIKPAAVAYDTVFPLPAKEGIKNIIRNVRCFPYTANNFLQGKFEKGLKNTLRIIINSTLGLGGIFDVATEMGIPESIETLGNTLYAWGWKESSYVIMPLMGPSTIRDAWGQLGDFFMQPPTYMDPDIRNIYYTGVLIDDNRESKAIRQLVAIAGVNDYEFVRTSFFQHRHFALTGEVVSNINDEGQNMLGEPPE